MLGKIFNNIVAWVCFFIVITTFSLVTRFFGRDKLMMKKRDVNSYWIDRIPVDPPQDSFKKQI